MIIGAVFVSSKMPNSNKPFLTFLAIFIFMSFAIKAQGQATVHPAKEVVLLKEEFDGPPLMALPEYNYGDTAFASVRDGHYVLDSRNSRRFWALRLETPAGLTARPTVLEMKMKVSTDSSNAQYGILWHTTHPAPHIFNEYVFTVYASGAFIIYAKINDQPYPVITRTPCTCVNKGSGAYNTLRIEEGAKGHYRFFVNDQPVYEGDLLIPTINTFGFYSDAHTLLSVDYVKFATITDVGGQ